MLEGLMLRWISVVGGLLIMMGQHDRSEALFYYFRLEDQISESHLLRLIKQNQISTTDPDSTYATKGGSSVGFCCSSSTKYWRTVWFTCAATAIMISGPPAIGIKQSTLLRHMASTKLPSTDKCLPCASPTSTHCRTIRNL